MKTQTIIILLVVLVLLGLIIWAVVTKLKPKQTFVLDTNPAAPPKEGSLDLSSIVQIIGLFYGVGARQQTPIQNIA